MEENIVQCDVERDGYEATFLHCGKKLCYVMPVFILKIIKLISVIGARRKDVLENKNRIKI